LEEIEDRKSEDSGMPIIKADMGEDLNSDDVINHREYAQTMQRINDIDMDDYIKPQHKLQAIKPSTDDFSKSTFNDSLAYNNSSQLQSKP